MTAWRPSRAMWGVAAGIAVVVLVGDAVLAWWPEWRRVDVRLTGAGELPSEVLVDGSRVPDFTAAGFSLKTVPTGSHELQVVRGADCTAEACGAGKCPAWCLVTTHAFEVPFGLSALDVPIELTPRAIGALEVARYAMIRVEPGSFVRGSPVDEPGRMDDEAQAPVTIERPFELGAVEVSAALWTEVMGRATDAAPDVRCSHADAQAFVDALNRKEGLSGAYAYRLPSEHEWEYVARNWTAWGFADLPGGALEHVDAVPSAAGAMTGLAPGGEAIVRGGRVAARGHVAPDARGPYTFRLARTVE